MGRNKDAVWSARRTRASLAAAAPAYVKRDYPFASWVVLRGEQGPACIERAAPPPKNCPDAELRVIVRWEGEIKKGTVIVTSAGRLRVLRFFPMNPRVRVAHLLCVGAPWDAIETAAGGRHAPLA